MHRCRPAYASVISAADAPLLTYTAPLPNPIPDAQFTETDASYTCVRPYFAPHYMPAVVQYDELAHFAVSNASGVTCPA